MIWILNWYSVKKNLSLTNVFAADSNDICIWSVSLAWGWNNLKETAILKCFKRGLAFLPSLVLITSLPLNLILKRFFVFSFRPWALIGFLMFLLTTFSHVTCKCLEDTSAVSLVAEKVNPLRRVSEGWGHAFKYSWHSLSPCPLGQFVNVFVIKVREKWLSYLNQMLYCLFSPVCQRKYLKWMVQYLKFKINWFSVNKYKQKKIQTYFSELCNRKSHQFSE